MVVAAAAAAAAVAAVAAAVCSFHVVSLRCFDVSFLEELDE